MDFSHWPTALTNPYALTGFLLLVLLLAGILATRARYPKSVLILSMVLIAGAVFTMMYDLVADKNAATSKNTPAQAGPATMQLNIGSGNAVINNGAGSVSIGGGPQR